MVIMNRSIGARLESWFSVVFLGLLGIIDRCLPVEEGGAQRNLLVKDTTRQCYYFHWFKGDEQIEWVLKMSGHQVQNSLIFSRVSLGPSIFLTVMDRWMSQYFMHCN